MLASSLRRHALTRTVVAPVAVCATCPGSVLSPHRCVSRPHHPHRRLLHTSPPHLPFDPAAPYPIWFFDPSKAPYKALLSVAESSAGCLETLQGLTGLPWWATIATGALLIRVAFFPVNVYSLRNASRFFDAREDIAALRRSQRTAVQALGPGASSFDKFRVLRVYLAGLRAALRKNNCYPLRTFLTPIMMTPFFFASVLGARHLVFLGDETFETGGVLWFTDLTVADPTYVMPVTALCMSYALLEIGFGGRPGQRRTVTGAPSMVQGSIVDKVKSALQMFLIASSPMITTLPAGIFVGWISSSVWSILYIKGIRSAGVYRAITGRDPPRVEDLEEAHEDAALYESIEVVGEGDEEVQDQEQVQGGDVVKEEEEEEEEEQDKPVKGAAGGGNGGTSGSA